MNVIGIDMATQPTNTGLALLDHEQREVLEVTTGEVDSPIETIAGWLERGPALLAIDAPLGWPVALGRELVEHRAGQPVGSSRNAMFRRHCDEWIRAQTGKTPLEVGADRIARTAHAAVELVEMLRRRTGLELDLAWSSEIEEPAIIEVYPAAVLALRGLPSSGYKRERDDAIRQQIVGGLEQHCVMPADDDLPLRNADALDAIVAAVAGMDFLDGRCTPPGPEAEELAHQEGWIWVAVS